MQYNKYENFKKHYKVLSESMAMQATLAHMIHDDPMLKKVLKAGTVKHFELVYDSGYEFIKEYLAQKHNLEDSSPKALFHTCENHSIFPSVMINELIMLTDARSKTMQIYEEALAQKVCNSIEKHYQVFGRILEIIKLPIE